VRIAVVGIEPSVVNSTTQTELYLVEVAGVEDNRWSFWSVQRRSDSAHQLHRDPEFELEAELASAQNNLAVAER